MHCVLVMQSILYPLARLPYVALQKEMGSQDYTSHGKTHVYYIHAIE